MSGYETVIADGPNSAFDDLKSVSQPVRDQLLDVIGNDLRPFPPRSSLERVLPSGWHWRRGSTRQQWARLHRFGYSREPDGEQAYDYVIVYRLFSAVEHARHRRAGFYVYRVLSNQELAGAALNLLLPDRTAVPRGRDRLAG